MGRKSRSRTMDLVSLLTLTLAIFHCPSPVSPYSMGAPHAACKNGVPQHGAQPQSSAAPFRISVDAAKVQSVEGQPVSVRLSGVDPDEAFIGFLLQARNATNGELTGKFRKANPNDEYSLVNCDNLDDAVTHANKRDKRQVSLLWEAPPGASGDVTFKGTFVKSKLTYWVGVESPKVRVERAVVTSRPPSSPSSASGSGAGTSTGSGRPSSADEETTVPLREPGRSPEPASRPVSVATTTTTTAKPETRKVPSSKSSLADLDEEAVYKGCFSEKGCFGTPDDCYDGKECKKLVTYSRAQGGRSFHVQLQGHVSELRNGDAYIAVGFSRDEHMGDDAVIACLTNGDRVKAMRGYNVPDGKNNRMTAEMQGGLSNFQGSVKDLVLSCSFDVEPEFTVGLDGSQHKFNLSHEPYHLLLATGTLSSASQVNYHTGGTARTSEASSLASYSVQAADDNLFIRLHGAFMFGAWIGSGSLGMLFARYYKTTWTGTQCIKKDIWFRLHQMFMVTTWGLTMAGFVLIFLAVGGWSAVSNPHPILGCVTTGLCFLQPIGALFRPMPDSPKRPIFNWLHWFGGNAAQIVGIVAMFFAIELDKAKLPAGTRWILVAFVAFHGLVHFILSIAQCVSENKRRESRADVYPMKDMAGPASYYYPQTKQDAPGGGLRKFLLALYMIVNILFTAVLVLLVIFAPIEDALKKYHLDSVCDFIRCS